MNVTLVDGKPVAHVPADDRALLYGDGLFETVAFRDRSAPLWTLHWRRFQHGCDILGLNGPASTDVLAQCRQVCPAQGLGVVRFQLSRGSGGRAYWPVPSSPPRLIVQARAWPGELEQQRLVGLRLCTARLRLASDSPLAGLKHCNRLEQVLAARECTELGCDEALLFNGQGQLVEAIASNLVVELDDELVVPDACAGVAGVGLDWLCKQSGISMPRRTITSEQLAAANAIMVINSVTGPRPARELDGRPLSLTSRCRALQQVWIDQLW